MVLTQSGEKATRISRMSRCHEVKVISYLYGWYKEQANIEIVVHDVSEHAEQQVVKV